MKKAKLSDGKIYDFDREIKEFAKRLDTNVKISTNKVKVNVSKEWIKKISVQTSKLRKKMFKFY